MRKRFIFVRIFGVKGLIYQYKSTVFDFPTQYFLPEPRVGDFPCVMR